MSVSNNKVYLETFGCQMNVSDSERVASSLTKQNFEIVETEERADIVLFNTCSVREKAEHKLYTRVGEIRAKRQSNPPLVGVMGCVAQLEGETLLDKPQKIDFVIGTKATGRVGQTIEQVVRDKRQSFDLADRENDYEWTVSPARRHSPYVAFVPIIEGCNKFCTYCIVPFSRGREQSRLAIEIVAEVERLKRENFREIHLIGQNVNSYRPKALAGLENFSGATPFVKLLRAVAATGIERIKFTTSFPRDFHADIVTAIEENPNLCNWVHLPVQSGSDRILRFMRRGHTIDSYYKHIERIKSSNRSIALSSDLIVGFPGETREDHEATLRLITSCEYDSLYIFKYSPRPGTPAASLADNVSPEEKQTRFLELEAAQRKIQKRKFADCVGKVYEVLAEKTSVKNNRELSGHTTCHKVVDFAAESISHGSIYQVKILQAKTNSLYGVAV